MSHSQWSSVPQKVDDEQHNDPFTIEADDDEDDLPVYSGTSSKNDKAKTTSNPFNDTDGGDLLGDIGSDPLDDRRVETDANTSNNNQNTSSGFGFGGFGNFSTFTNPTTIGGDRVEERRFAGGDTLDEPVLTTLMRDVKKVGQRLLCVVWPRMLNKYIPDSTTQVVEGSESLLHEWDLWGPLTFCLLFSLVLALLAPDKQSSIVFSGTFFLIWLGLALTTVNIQLLGGSISYFHALSIIGYSLFPLLLAVAFSTFIKWHFIRAILDTFFVGWGLYSASYSLRNSGVLPGRLFLALFPVGLFFLVLGWLCVVT